MRNRMIKKAFGGFVFLGLLAVALCTQSMGQKPPDGYEIWDCDSTMQDGGADTIKAPEGYQWHFFEIWDCATDDALATLQFVRKGANATSSQLVVIRGSANITEGIKFYAYTSPRMPRSFHMSCGRIVITNTQGSWSWCAYGKKGLSADGVTGETWVP